MMDIVLKLLIFVYMIALTALVAACLWYLWAKIDEWKFEWMCRQYDKTIAKYRNKHY
jgi:hypothetical protein